jgi:dTDP-4-amino-4,6-dideoxygalactose transaminase
LGIVDVYERAFAKHKHLLTLKTKPGFQSSRYLYVIQLNLETLSIDRDQFIDEMFERNIGTSVHYKPIHMNTYYAQKYGWTPESFPNSYRAYERMLSLPLSSRMTVQDAADVVTAVEDICATFRR